MALSYVVARAEGFQSDESMIMVFTVSFSDTAIVGELILIEIRGGVVVILSFGLVSSYMSKIKRRAWKFVRFVHSYSLAEIGKALGRWLLWAWYMYFFLIHLVKFILVVCRLSARICGVQPPGTEAIDDVDDAWTMLVA